MTDIEFVSYGHTLEFSAEDLANHQPLNLTERVLAQALEDWDAQVDREMIRALVEEPAARDAMMARHVAMRETMLDEVKRRVDAGETFSPRDIDDMIAKLQRESPWPPADPIEDLAKLFGATRRAAPSLSRLPYRADIRK